MRISDWSSDVCSSDLRLRRLALRHPPRHLTRRTDRAPAPLGPSTQRPGRAPRRGPPDPADGRGRRRRRRTRREDLPPERLLRIGNRSELPVRRSHRHRSEEHTSELQSLMRISYAVFGLKKKRRKLPTTKSIETPDTCKHGEY